MKKIELEQWEPFPGDPRRMQYAGQRVAQEVFEELKHRLEGMGYLPDEYFLMDREWENGREIPKDADIFCTTDYGGNEGVYLDVSLQWSENNRTVTRNFIRMRFSVCLNLHSKMLSVRTASKRFISSRKTEELLLR